MPTPAGVTWNLGNERLSAVIRPPLILSIANRYSHLLIL